MATMLRHRPLRFNLPGAYIPSARLQRTDMYQANLAGANCMKADFSDARMLEANLRGTILVEANLQRVDFDSADLTGADLRGADLTDAINLTEKQIRSAIVDDETKLPQLDAAPA